MAARICPQCRTRVDERRAKTSPYCLSCGFALGTQATGFGKPPAKSSALPWILGGIGIVLLLAFGAVVLVVIAVANAEPDPPVPVPTAETDSGVRLEVPTATATVSAKPTATVKATAAPPTVTGVRPPPTVVPPTIPTPTTPTVLAFPRARATNELDRVTAGLASCKRAGDPTGSGSIRVDFEPDGRVGTLLGRPFSGTPTGSCVSSRFLAIKIGAFNGTTQQIQRTFTIPPDS